VEYAKQGAWKKIAKQEKRETNGWSVLMEGKEGGKKPEEGRGKLSKKWEEGLSSRSLKREELEGKRKGANEKEKKGGEQLKGEIGPKKRGKDRKRRRGASEVRGGT